MNESMIAGRPRWHYVLGVMFFAQVSATVGFSMIFPFLPLYVNELGSTVGLSVEWMAGLVIAVQGFTMMIASPFWGAMSDRHGRKLMVLRATFGGTVLLALMGIVTSGEQLIFLRALQGLVTGTVSANAALVAASVPRERVGFAMGMMQTGLWAGVALGPLIGGVLADNFGYSNSFFITATMLSISGLLVLFGVKENFVPEPKKADEPPWYKVMRLQFQHVMQAEGVRPVFFTRFLANIGRSMIFPFSALFVVLLVGENSPNQNVFSGLVIAVSSFTLILSSGFLGRLGDRVGHRNILLASSALATVCYIPQVFVTDIWQLLVLQALTGFALGGIVSAPAALLARYTAPGEEGSVYGIDNSVVAGARAIAPLIGSTIVAFIGLRGVFGATAIFFGLVVVITYFLLPEDEVLLPRKNAKVAVAAGD